MLVSALVGFLVAFAVLRVTLRHFADRALDAPNERSLHRRPVPRTGGLAILAGAVAALAFGGATLGALFGLALALAAFSFLDDLHGLPASARLAVHAAAAAAALWLLEPPARPLLVGLVAVGIVWMTNAYNFMDGSDGLAGGMAAIGFGAYAVAAASAGHLPLAAISAAIAAASLAFLTHNFHPARIFLGDVGAIPLGFLAAVLGVLGWRDEAWPLWFPMLVFGVFNADATVTLLRRALRGERVWQAHHGHYYQRMVRMGLGHRGTAWTSYALMLTCAVAALFARTEPAGVQAAAFAAATAVLAAAAAWVDLRWIRFQRGST